MNGGRFLVGLKEVNTSEKILKIRSLIKEGIIFWEENLYADNSKRELVSKLFIDINNMRCSINDLMFPVSSRGVVIYIIYYLTICTAPKSTRVLKII